MYIYNLKQQSQLHNVQYELLYNNVYKLKHEPKQFSLKEMVLGLHSKL